MASIALGLVVGYAARKYQQPIKAALESCWNGIKNFFSHPNHDIEGQNLGIHVQGLQNQQNQQQPSRLEDVD